MTLSHRRGPAAATALRAGAAPFTTGNYVVFAHRSARGRRGHGALGGAAAGRRRRRLPSWHAGRPGAGEHRLRFGGLATDADVSWVTLAFGRSPAPGFRRPCFKSCSPPARPRCRRTRTGAEVEHHPAPGPAFLLLLLTRSAAHSIPINQKMNAEHRQQRTERELMRSMYNSEIGRSFTLDRSLSEALCYPGYHQRLLNPLPRRIIFWPVAALRLWITCHTQHKASNRREPATLNRRTSVAII